MKNRDELRNGLFILLLSVSTLLLDNIVLTDNHLGINNLAFLGGLVAGAANLFGNLFGANQERKNIQRTHRHQRQMAEYEWSKNLEMWHLQNAYNTPQAQMNRFRDAGLNENLIYGQGSPGNATQLPKYQAPNIDFSGMPSMPGAAFSGVAQGIQTYQDMLLRQAQIDNAREERKVLEQDAANKAITGKYIAPLSEMKADSLHQKMLLDLQRQWQLESISHGWALAAGYPGEGWWNEYMDKYQGELAKSQLGYASGKVRSQSQAVEKMLADIGKTKAETDLKQQQADYYLIKMIADFGGSLLRTGINVFGRKRGLSDGRFNQRTKSFDSMRRTSSPDEWISFGKRHGF